MNKEKWNGIRSFRERYTYVPAPDWYLKSEDEIIDWLIVNNNEKKEKKIAAHSSWDYLFEHQVRRK